MSSQSEGFSLLDSIAIVSFMIGLENYSKNTKQLYLQDTVNEAIFDLHKHIKVQEEKLDEILNLLKELIPYDGNKGSE